MVSLVELGGILCTYEDAILHDKATPQKTSGYHIIDTVRSLCMCARAPPRLLNSAVVVGSRRRWPLQEAKSELPLQSSALLVIMRNPRSRWDFVFLATLLWQHELYSEKRQSSVY
jgi:hypothetical protein